MGIYHLFVIYAVEWFLGFAVKNTPRKHSVSIARFQRESHCKKHVTYISLDSGTTIPCVPASKAQAVSFGHFLLPAQEELVCQGRAGYLFSVVINE